MQLIAQWVWNGRTIDLPGTSQFRAGNLEQIFQAGLENFWESSVIKNALLLCFVVNNMKNDNKGILPEIQQALWCSLDENRLEETYNRHLQVGHNLSQIDVATNTRRAVNARIVSIRAALQFLPSDFAGILGKYVEGKIELVWQNLEQILHKKQA